MNFLKHGPNLIRTDFFTRGQSRSHSSNHGVKTEFSQKEDQNSKGAIQDSSFISVTATSDASRKLQEN